MPIYQYVCADCSGTFSVNLSMSEEQEVCELCESTKISKCIQDASDLLSGKESIQKVGDLVKKHIELSREEVKQQKREAKKELV